MSQTQGNESLFPSEHTRVCPHTRPTLSPMGTALPPSIQTGKVMTSQWRVPITSPTPEMSLGPQGGRGGGVQAPEYHNRPLEKIVQV